MLEKQSLDEFISNIDKGKVVIVSLSPQSRASLAVHFGISPLKVKFEFVMYMFCISHDCIEFSAYILLERTRATRKIL